LLVTVFFLTDKQTQIANVCVYLECGITIHCRLFCFNCRALEMEAIFRTGLRFVSQFWFRFLLF